MGMARMFVDGDGMARMFVMKGGGNGDDVERRICNS
jgi:hypothetical protein